MNQVILVGRLVKEISIKTINTQHKVVNNVLAINRRNRNKNGEQITDFIPIVAWDHLAEILSNYCQKGQRIAIHGKLQSRHYTTSDDQQRYVIECLLQEITLLDRVHSEDKRPPHIQSDNFNNDLTFAFEPVVE